MKLTKEQRAVLDEAVFVSVVGKRAPNKRVYLRRLQSWIVEKRTNHYGMAHLADRAIACLLTDIADFWPGTDTTKWTR